MSHYSNSLFHSVQPSSLLTRSKLNLYVYLSTRFFYLPFTLSCFTFTLSRLRILAKLLSAKFLHREIRYSFKPPTNWCKNNHRRYFEQKVLFIIFLCSFYPRLFLQSCLKFFLVGNLKVLDLRSSSNFLFCEVEIISKVCFWDRISSPLRRQAHSDWFELKGWLRPYN